MFVVLLVGTTLKALTQQSRHDARSAPVAAARESRNADLWRHSGASSVIVSSETVARLPGLTPSGRHAVEVVEDLVPFGSGLDLLQRDVRPDEVGATATTP